MDEQTYTYAIIDDSTSLVVNRVSWDGVTDWSPGDGLTAVLVEDQEQGGIGDSYKNGVFTAAVSSTEE